MVEKRINAEISTLCRYIDDNSKGPFDTQFLHFSPHVGALQAKNLSSRVQGDVVVNYGDYLPVSTHEAK
jgi:hypothetical protein